LSRKHSGIEEEAPILYNARHGKGEADQPRLLAHRGELVRRRGFGDDLKWLRDLTEDKPESSDSDAVYRYPPQQVEVTAAIRPLGSVRSLDGDRVPITVLAAGVRIG